MKNSAESSLKLGRVILCAEITIVLLSVIDLVILKQEARTFKT